MPIDSDLLSRTLCFVVWVRARWAICVAMYNRCLYSTNLVWYFLISCVIANQTRIYLKFMHAINVNCLRHSITRISVEGSNLLQFVMPNIVFIFVVLCTSRLFFTRSVFLIVFFSALLCALWLGIHYLPADYSSRSHFHWLLNLIQHSIKFHFILWHICMLCCYCG